MPCDSSHCRRDERESESVRVLLSLAELGESVGMFDPYYGRVSTLDHDTAWLCARLKQLNPLTIRGYSLELQIWWRDHQKADAAREAREEQERIAAEKRAEALRKLSPEDREALGLVFEERSEP